MSKPLMMLSGRVDVFTGTGVVGTIVVKVFGS